jgi:hypothetical protein
MMKNNRNSYYANRAIGEGGLIKSRFLSVLGNYFSFGNIKVTIDQNGR